MNTAAKGACANAGASVKGVCTVNVSVAVAVVAASDAGRCG